MAQVKVPHMEWHTLQRCSLAIGPRHSLDWPNALQGVENVRTAVPVTLSLGADTCCTANAGALTYSGAAESRLGRAPARLQWPAIDALCLQSKETTLNSLEAARARSTFGLLMLGLSSHVFTRMTPSWSSTSAL